MAPGDAGIADGIRALLSAREAGASICPSDVARRLAPDAWRPMMPSIRRVARGLAAAGTIAITQSGQAVDPAAPWTGPIRLRRGAQWEDVRNDAETRS